MTFKEARKAAREIAYIYWSYIYKDNQGEWTVSGVCPENVPEYYFYSKDNHDYFLINKAGVILHNRNYIKCVKKCMKNKSAWMPIFIDRPRNRKENETKEEYHKYLTAMRIL